jgi:hypothetical protein
MRGSYHDERGKIRAELGFLQRAGRGMEAHVSVILAEPDFVGTGLLTLNTRATRHLAGDAPPEPKKPTLTPEQLQRIADLRTFAAKKQKVAQLLIQSDLPEEAEPHQKAAEKALAVAEGIESGAPVYS